MFVVRRVASSRDERGLTIVVLGLVLTLLMIFAAFALDVGGSYNLRRQVQSAADYGVLSAAQDLPTTSTARGTVISYINQVLSRSFVAADFNACSGDSGALARIDAAANCISYDNSFSQVRVTFPAGLVKYATALGSIIGAKNFN